MALSLTNPGIAYDDQSAPMIDGTTGQVIGAVPRVQFFKNKTARNQQLFSDMKSTLDKTKSVIDPDTGEPTGSVPNMPQKVDPSFAQMASPDPNTGLTPPISSGETKLGKLLHVLTAAARGAAIGGTAPNFAQGFEASEVRPIQMASMRLGLQQQQAQTALTRAQSTMVQTPYGPMPVGIAKLMFPAMIRAGGQRDVANINAGSRQNVANTEAQSRENVANINKRFIPVEGVGLFDTQSRTVMPGTANSITITDEIAKDYDLPPEFIGKPMRLSDLNAFRFQNVPEMTAEGPIVVNRRTSTATPVVGPGGKRYSPPTLAGPIQVADPDNPGETIIVPKGQSFGMAGTQSASVAVPKAAGKAEVPTKIGDQKVAFTTMIQHAELLREAARALNNGDIRTLAGLKNAFKNEFGYAGPITAQAIADAYGGEVTNVIAKGHMTDKEIEKTGKTIDPNKQNFETIDSVLQAYQNLAQSKMNMLNQQEQNAIKNSQPKKKAGNFKSIQERDRALGVVYR